ncbi:glutamine-hydrolyzing GMP synthase [Clostridiaceae bacterium M8S5]|nr:glutamine-hydrolyzing GMP synthase [Clostridiaceae bacterium M8S5]
MQNDVVLILDFGGQYSQLIARRVREANIYCEIIPYNYSLDKIKEKNPKAIILSGGPSNVFEENAPKCDEELFKMGVPVMGICYGGQLMAQVFGGEVTRADTREYGQIKLDIMHNDGIFESINEEIKCLMSHTNFIGKVPENFVITARTKACPVAAMKSQDGKLIAIQFHPEVEHTDRGKDIIANFLYNVSGLKPNWDMGDFAKEMIEQIKDEIGDKRAICALSGGVDSAVAAVMVNRAIGSNLICIFVDHGLLRKNEGDQVEEVFRDKFNLNLIRVNAQERFLSKLAGVVDPEEKRKIIGEEFIRVFEEEKEKLKAQYENIDFLVQGTIYPDVIESGTDKADVIKSHHNVGGLPEDVDFKLVEPLRQLFKDEVRAVGTKLNIPQEIVQRQPFPGPGLAIRVIGDITEEKLEIVREADWVFREEIRKAGLDKDIWQYFAVLPGIKTVGVMGDERTHTHTIALRAVTSSDGMTSDWARIPFDVLNKISKEVVNNVENINRVVYDITSKPPATIEWE